MVPARRNAGRGRLHFSTASCWRKASTSSRIRSAADEEPASGDQCEEQINHEATVVTPRNGTSAASCKLLIPFEHGLSTTHSRESGTEGRCSKRTVTSAK